MLSLIAREIRDHAVYIGACWTLTAIIIGILIGLFLWDVEFGGLVLSAIVIPVMYLGFCSLGAAQMYADRANRLSALLATQATTRTRILAARVLVGGGTILVTLVPVVVAYVVLLKLKVPPFEFYAHIVWEVSLVLILVGFACYCMGLLVGWTGSRVRLIAGSLVLIASLLGIVAVRGFGPSAALLVALLSIAVLGRVWHTFTSAPL